MTQTARHRLVVVGNGMAGHRLLAELAARGLSHGVRVFGAEPVAAYNRILLSSVLSSDRALGDISLAGPDWYAANGIALATGDAVVAIDRDARTVTSAAGKVVDYDTLVLATGSRPIRLPLPGIDLPGVVAFRDLADLERMRALVPGAKAVVIGGGLLGLEAAAGLAKRGIAVSVVHLMPDLMERQLDGDAASLLAAELAARGIALFLGAQTQAIVAANGRAAGVRLADGRVLGADLVVQAVGVAPETALARAAGLDCARGVKIDDTLATSDPHIVALGECAEHRGLTFGLVAPIWEQARVLADRLAGRPAVYTGSPQATNLKVSGIDLFSAGTVRETAGAEALVLDDRAAGVYRKLVLRDGRLEGALLYGDIEDASWYASLIGDRTDVSHWRDALMFGSAYVAPASAPALAAD